MDWAGEKNVCSAYACPALRLLGTPGLPLPRQLLRHEDKKTSGFGGYMPSAVNQAKSCQNQGKSCHAMQKIVRNELFLQAVHTCTPWRNSIFSAQNRVKSYSPRPYAHVCPGRMRQPKTIWPRKKKNGKLGETTTADHRGRGRRRPGSLSRADGQLTRAGQRYYSHLGLRPPSKDFDYNQPLIREGPNDYILLPSWARASSATSTTSAWSTCR